MESDRSGPSELLGPPHHDPRAGDRVDPRRGSRWAGAVLDADVIRPESGLNKDGHFGNAHAQAARDAPAQVGRALMQMVLLHCCYFMRLYLIHKKKKRVLGIFHTHKKTTFWAIKKKLTKACHFFISCFFLSLTEKKKLERDKIFKRT